MSRFDHRVTGSIKELPSGIRPVMGAASILGEPIIVGLVATYGATYGWLYGNHQLFWAFGATLMAAAADAALKQFLRRTRPDTSYVTSMRFKSYSFPSGHAFGALLTYGLLAYLATKFGPMPWGYVSAASLSALIIVIGLSRVYLGAHYPTDVLGGWLLGGVVLVAIIKIIPVS